MKHFFYLFQSNPSQDVQDIDITESEIYCPFINHTKTVNHDVLSSLSISPLSIHLGSKKVKDGGRIYLDKFCSVTSILSQTKPPSEFFALKNWAKSQVSELGKEKFKEKKKSISRRGTLFHHVSTANIWVEKTGNISRCYHRSPREMRSEKLAQKFHSDDTSLPRFG